MRFEAIGVVKQTVALINMETFQMESCVRGYLVYKDLWERCQKYAAVP